MKSLTAVCQTGASMPAIKTNGRVARHPRHRADGENAEMKMYLSKLKDLVPFMPKRKLSKLEIIQHVIDYICDLQTELETHPEIGNFDAATALSFANVNANNSNTDDEQYNSNHSDEDMLTPTERLAIEAMQQQQFQLLQQQHQSSPANATAATTTTTNIRQPLVDRQTPNTILPPTTASAAAATAIALATTITTTATPTPLMSLQIQSQSHQQHFQTATTAQTPSIEKDSRQQPC